MGLLAVAPTTMATEQDVPACLEDDEDHIAPPPSQLPPEATQLLESHGISLDTSSQTPAERNATTAKATSLLESHNIVLAPLEHESLKYHLLGPSLTKAGQDTVDQKKVSEIIYEASKGSRFFANEERKDAVLTEKINRILARKRQLEKLDLSSATRKADEYLTNLELSRDLSQYCVHLDCDAFYAAVEELDRPDLKDMPFAVGKGVLTTCNYHARKFGCRSGMAGFVAMKLCPQLVCLPLNFEKYTAKAQEVRSIIADYDPNFESASIDEAYLNITEYCASHQQDPEEVVNELRARVHQECKITVSAGIAPNARLAKIASNQNKPNGQCRVANERAAMMSFIGDLPTRKVNGIGRVFERELDAIGIKQCSDIYEHRAILCSLFGEKSWHFLASVYLGLGKTDIRPAESYERKSVGTERTFHDMSSKEELREKLRHTAEELEKDAKRAGVKGRTLVLKIKLHTYEVISRQVVPGKTIANADELYLHGERMLGKLEKEIPDMKLRLMGLRLTQLVSTQKPDVDDFFGLANSSGALSRKQPRVDQDGWEVWPMEEDNASDDAAADLGEDEAEEGLDDETLTYMGDHVTRDLETGARRHGKEVLPNPAGSRGSLAPDSHEAKAGEAAQEEQRLPCPICQRPQPADDRLFNEHIDFCLSKQTIQDAVRQASPTKELEAETPHPQLRSDTAPAVSLLKRGGRGRLGSASAGGVKRPASSGGAETGLQQKKLFFA